MRSRLLPLLKVLSVSYVTSTYKLPALAHHRSWLMRWHAWPPTAPPPQKKPAVCCLRVLHVQAADDSMAGDLMSVVQELKHLLVGTLLWNPLLFMHVGVHHLVSGQPVVPDADHSAGTIAGIGLDADQEAVLSTIGGGLLLLLAVFAAACCLCRVCHVACVQAHSLSSFPLAATHQQAAPHAYCPTTSSLLSAALPPPPHTHRSV